MKQSNLSKWLKVVIIGLGICGAAVYLYILPFFGSGLATDYPEFAHCFWPWMIVMWVTAVPCYFILACAWQIATEIGRDHSFSHKNARLLKYISGLALADTTFYFLVNILYLLLGMNHPSIVLASLLVVLVGVAVTVAAAALSHLVYKAAMLQEENDLTI
jgi:hypothetical protein